MTLRRIHPRLFHDSDLYHICWKALLVRNRDCAGRLWGARQSGVAFTELCSIWHAVHCEQVHEEAVQRS